jgi:hypothetical protein
MEVLKVLGGFGDPLSQRMQTLDAADSSFYTVKLKQRNSACAVCSSTHRSINTMQDSKQWSVQNGLEHANLVLPEGLPTIRCVFILYNDESSLHGGQLRQLRPKRVSAVACSASHRTLRFF